MALVAAYFFLPDLIARSRLAWKGFTSKVDSRCKVILDLLKSELLLENLK